MSRAWFGLGRRKHPSRKPATRLQLEALEDRCVPAVIYTEYSQVAELFPRHRGPTTLFLNFDGYQAERVAPFLTISGDREGDIREILHRTAEVFSPFDVQVVRIFGDAAHGRSNGESTVFIGDYAYFTKNSVNEAGGVTPARYADRPGNGKGIHHRPNSDRYDIAYVDPVAGGVTVWSNEQIVRTIAHEAGHTFGLGHVLSGGQPDVMSYDTSNLRFMDASFTITNRNGPAPNTSDDVVPKWHFRVFPFHDASYRLQTQNSYRFLTAVLGPREADDHTDVVHTNAVHYPPGAAASVLAGTNLVGTIERPGDYDVFRFTPTTNRTLTITAQSLPGQRLDTALLVYRGDTLVAHAGTPSAADPRSQVTYTFDPRYTYSIVVGADGGASAGAYQLLVGASDPDTVGPRVTSAVLHSLPVGGLRYLTVTFNEAVNPATFTAADVSLIGPSGRPLTTAISVSEVAGSNQRQYTVRLGGGFPPGTYTVRIGPNVNDFAGNPMNQDGDTVNGEADQDRYSLIFTVALPRPF